MTKRIVAAFGIVSLMTALGCLIRTEHTIDAHITVDIRHIAEQAEGVLDFVEGKSDQLPGLEGAPADEPTSWFRNVLNAIAPVRVAYAAEQELKKTSSPLVREIAVGMRERYEAIEALKEKNCFGENNRGYLELRPCEAMEDAEAKNEAQKLLALENKGRKALYNEIARLNKDDGVSVSTVERIYAVERLNRAESGEIFQLPPPGAAFEDFKKSAKGKALGDKCKPNAWVTIP